MNQANSEIFEKLRQQYDRSPYPRIPLEDNPKTKPISLYHESLATAFYRRNKTVISSTQDKLILDVACGSGYTTLSLAEANPGAKIIGIDISQASLEMAEARLKYHGHDQVKFHLMSLEDVSQLNLKFDYINAVDILYFLTDLDYAFQKFVTVLKPNGIIRGDLHSYHQRYFFYRAQEIFQRLGLMEDNPEEMEAEVVREFFRELHDGCQLKVMTWNQALQKENDEQYIMMNYLIQGDKGFTIAQMFDLIDSANLEFISMVNWWQWNLSQLFKDPENLPISLAFILDGISIKEELTLFELIQNQSRSLDFWCGYPQPETDLIPISEWTEADWQQATIYLHPILHQTDLSETLSQPNQFSPLILNNYSPLLTQPINLDRTIASAIFKPLLQAPQSLITIAEQWLQFHPINLGTLEPTTQQEAWEITKQAVIEQESYGTVLIEK
ncbi:Methyltransferase type 12 [Rippkaea orientalis PCC 8801]|uniref:Methyltransferase type 12 n=1 Tax=Rippkaea orientalis (strain PCC 8801 / RF-1) TaxID=41431 RepID=B7JYZ7_RIPO1|nr:class I SAM-dependent methyltransferase [Rippkaea orientalis]ACK66074.1 Methyltransferase type 12 [Rippkaea orientalis PCC 8801]